MPTGNSIALSSKPVTMSNDDIWIS